MNFSDIIKYADGYGLGGVIILSIISMIIALSKLEWFAKLVTNLVSKNPKSKNVETSKKTIRETDIVNHDIIRFIDFWLYSKVPTFPYLSIVHSFKFT